MIGVARGEVAWRRLDMRRIGGVEPHPCRRGGLGWTSFGALHRDVANWVRGGDALLGDFRQSAANWARGGGAGVGRGRRDAYRSRAVPVYALCACSSLLVGGRQHGFGGMTLGSQCTPLFPVLLLAPLARKAIKAFDSMMADRAWAAPQSTSAGEARELAQVRQLVTHARADRTTVGYGASWLRFVLWCEERRAAGQLWVTALPASDLTCARYIAFLLFGGKWTSTGRAQKPLQPATVACYCSAINHVHFLNNMGRPCNDWLASEARKGGAHLFGVPSKQAQPLRTEMVWAIMEGFGAEQAAFWQNMIALFVVILFLCGNRWSDMTMLFSSGMRVDAATRVSSEDQARAFLRLFLARRKTDQRWDGSWQVLGAGDTRYCPLAFFLRVAARAREHGFVFGEGTSCFLFPRVERRGATRGRVGDSFMEPRRRRFAPTFVWGAQAGDGDRIKYQDMFHRALVACCKADPGSVARFWTTHAGRVGMQSDCDVRNLDRCKSRLLGGWAYDPKEKTQDHYSQTVHTLSSLSAERGF